MLDLPDTPVVPTARQVLSEFGIPPANLTALRPATPGFSDARVFRIALNGTLFALRCTPAHTVPLNRLTELARLLGVLKSQGLPTVAVPIVTTTGSPYVVLQNSVWQLEPWLPGTADFRANSSPERLRNIMAAVAAWHLAAAQYQPTPPAVGWLGVRSGHPAGLVKRCEKILHYDPLWRDLARRNLARNPWHEFVRRANRIVDAADRLTAKLTRALHTAAQQRVALQPCLRDLWHDHVLLTGDQVTGLVDPHACETDSVAADLSRLLGSLLPPAPLAAAASSWTAALDAYESHRPLAPAERGLLTVYHHSGVLLSGLGWVDRLQLTPRAPDNARRILDRLDGILAHLETLPDAEVW